MAAALIAGTAFAAGQEKAVESTIRHEPATSFKHGDILDVRAEVPAGMEAVRFFFRHSDIKEFQVRTMERREGNLFGYRLDTSELPVLEFEYYIAAVIGARSETLPADPSKECFRVRGTAAEAIPEAPSEAPPAEPQPKAAPKFQWPAEANGSVQAALRDPQAPPDAAAVTARGNIRLFTKLQKNSTALDFNSNFALSSQTSTGQNAIDLSNLSLSLSAGRHTFVAGDVNVNESEFSVSGFGRRGLDYLHNDQTTYVHLFDVNSQQVKGFQGFGLPKKSSSLWGGAFGRKFFGEALSLKAVYLRGDDDPGEARNVGFASNYRPRRGNVLAVVQDVQLLKNTLILSGEFARSSFDADTEDELSSKEDSAFRLGGLLTKGKLTIGIRYRHIGKDFNPIGFSYFTNDRNNADAQIGLNLGRITINGTCLVSRDNVENDPAASTTRTVQLNSVLMWTITPKLTINLTYLQNKQRTDAGRDQISFFQDSSSHQVSGTVHWMLGAANTLSCTVTSADMGSRKNPQMDSRNLTIALNGAFRSEEFFSLTPTLSYAVMNYGSAGPSTHTWSSFVAAEVNVLPRLLTTALTGSYMSMTTGPDNFTRNLVLSWQINLSSQRFLKKGKAVLSLRGNYNRASTFLAAKGYVSWLLQTDFSF